MPRAEHDEERMIEIEKLYKKHENDHEEFLLNLCDLHGNVEIFIEPHSLKHFEAGKATCGATYRLNPRDAVVKAHIDDIGKVYDNGYLVEVYY
jgi:hypothetical protein